MIAVPVEVANESGIPVDEQELARLARFLLDELGVHPLVELSLLLVDSRTMRGLHEQYLDEPGPTDVLAFPMDELDEPVDDVEEPPVLLGDVVICPEVADRQAGLAGGSLTDELHTLCTHGVLHLLGYDHGEPDDGRAMFDLQDRLLARWRAARTGPR